MMTAMFPESAWRLYPLKKMKKKVDLVSSLAWSPGSGIRKSAWNGNWDSTGKKRQPVMVVPVILNMTRLQVCFLLTVSGKRLTV